MNKFEQIRAQAIGELNQEYLKCPDNWIQTVEKRIFELTVEECISIAENQRNPQHLNYKPSERFVEDLKRHFGVK